jgi:hypothetical protein
MAKTTETGLSRRKMMLVAGGAVAGAGALMAAPFREEITVGVREVVVGTGVGRGLLSLASANYEEWESVVGTSFSLGGRTSVDLVGLRALPTSGEKPQGVRSQGFAAFFDPPRGQSVAPDLIYTATHSIYGPTQIYLAGTSDRRTPGRMVAIFN